MRRELSIEWIERIVASSLPFHLKFYISFLTVDADLMHERAGRIFNIVFSSVLDSGFIESIINDESKLCLKYQSELLFSRKLLLASNAGNIYVQI